MRLSKFIAGLLILEKYYVSDGYYLGAEHDEIFLMKTNKPLSDYDFQKMIALGWRQIESADGDVIYDPEDGWRTYV